jgi:hypothetical protein
LASLDLGNGIIKQLYLTKHFTKWDKVWQIVLNIKYFKGLEKGKISHVYNHMIEAFVK